MKDINNIWTKTEQVRSYLETGDIERALKIAKNFKKTYNITQKELDQLRLGWDCLKNPDFYKQLGRDIDLETSKAIEILFKIYK